MRRLQGFTLIELVVVIVILAILAATALPKYVDLTSSANTAAVNGVAGALNSASAVNYGARQASSTLGVTITACADVANALQGGLPSGYTITGPTMAAGAAVTCTISNGTANADFIGIGAS